MDTLHLSLTDLKSPGYIAQIGFVGENECRRLAIDCSEVFEEYPTAIPSIAVTSPNHCEPYPSVVERDGLTVIWTVTDTNLTEEGIGEFQLTFTVGTVVKKSYTGKYRVKKSLMPTGSVPDPLDDFITRASALISEIQQTILDKIVATVPAWALHPVKPVYTAEEVGALPDSIVVPTKVSDLTDDSGHYTKPPLGIPAEDLASGVIPDLSGKADKVQNAVNGHLAALDVAGNLTDSGKYAFEFVTASQVGAVNGVAELDPNGKVPSSQLPSYVDDVVEYSSASAFPNSGETGKIYVAKDTNATYRWTGSTYAEIGSSLALGETSSTAYRGDRGAAAYEHAMDPNRILHGQQTGFFKIAATDEGHVAFLAPVTKEDITDLGIPEEVPDITGKADKIDTVLTTTLSRGRKANTTVGTASFAFGDTVEASGANSHAEGAATTASGSLSHAEGGGTTASESASHAEGGGTTASGQASHAEGTQTEASGNYAHAEGISTIASGTASHAECGGATASGNYSHAEGSGTTASGMYAHSEGLGTIANHKSQHVFGEYNIADSSSALPGSRGNYVEVVGNGATDNARSNARTLDWDGNEELAGDLTVNKGTADEISVSDLKDAVDAKIDEPSSEGTSGQVLTTDGNGGRTWTTAGAPTDAQVENAVSDWLDGHPSATTTVQDGSITKAKLDNTLQAAVDDVSDLKNEIQTMNPAATSSDVGKALKVKTVYNGKVAAWEYGKAGDSFTTVAKQALLACLQNVAWTTDDGQALYDALEEALDLNPTSYTVTYSLTNCVSSNASASAYSGELYTTTISSYSTLAMASATVSVTMGGVDITSTAYSNGTVRIEEVTGNVVITASVASGYTFYDYIGQTQSFNANYGIICDFSLSTDYTIEADFYYNNTTGDNLDALFGTRKGTGSSSIKRFALFIKPSTRQLGYWYGGTDTVTEITSALNNAEVNHVVVKPVGSSETYPLDAVIDLNGTEYDTTSTATGETWESWFGIFGYATSASASTSIHNYGTRIGHIQMTNSQNTIVHDLIPAHNGTYAGMYDFATNTFYCNEIYNSYYNYGYWSGT